MWLSEFLLMIPRVCHHFHLISCVDSYTLCSRHPCLLLLPNHMLCTCLGCSPHFCTHHTPTEMTRQTRDHFVCKAFSSGKLAIVFSVLAIICTFVRTLVSHIVIYRPVPDLYLYLSLFLHIYFWLHSVLVVAYGLSSFRT